MRISFVILAILLVVSCRAQLKTTQHSESVSRNEIDASAKFNSFRISSPQALFESMESNRQWPSYRGYLASGYLDHAHLPDSFNIETGYNIKWSRDIPGLGLSCPVIWNDRVFLTTAVSENDTTDLPIGIAGDVDPVEDTSEHVWKVLCFDTSSGDLIWERDALRGIPMVKRHPKSTHANTSVATNGTHVVAFFGSEGLYCYNYQGDLIWKRDFGLIKSAWDKMESAEWEFSSSPLIFRNKVIIQADALNIAFVAVLDLESGKTLWRQERDEVPGWCTPNIYFSGDQPIVAVNGYKHVGGYDLESGREVWKMSGGGDIPIPSPVIWKDLIFFNSAHGKHAPLMAIKGSAAGEIIYPEKTMETEEPIAWIHNREGAYMSSVLVYDSLLYNLKWNGNLTCYDARSGERIYSQTIHPSSFVASPVASDHRIYILSEIGDLYIIRAGRSYELINKIPIGGISLVSPGISPGMLILRTSKKLIAVSGT